MGRSVSAGVLAAGLAVTVVSAGLSVPAWAEGTSAAAAASAVAEPTNLASAEDKVKAAAVLGILPDIDMLVLDDQNFVLALWRAAAPGTFVQSAALRAWDTTDTTAAYDFIVTGIFTAAQDDARVEIAAEQAKALRRSVAVIVGLDPSETALIEKSDRDFIIAVWERAADGSHVKAAAQAAFAEGSTQTEWTAFLTGGAKTAADQDLADAVAQSDAEQAAKLLAAQLASAKRALLQLLLLPVTEELIAAPNRQYVLQIHAQAKGIEVQLASQAALNAPDADVEQALKDFIFTGGAAANARDEATAAAAELALYRTRTTAIRDAAKVDGQQPNLVAAADLALTTNTALALQTFLNKGQDTARALDKARGVTTVNALVMQHDSQCLAVSAGSTTAGAAVIQWSCNGGPEQDWRIQPRGTGYEVRNDHSKMCLTVYGGSKSNAADLVQWGCGATNAAQAWQLTKASNGYTQLRNVNSGQCLAFGSASTTKGDQAIQWPCAAGHAEQSVNVKARTSGQRIANKNSGLCLSNGGDQTNGAHILQTACSDSNDAEWHVNALGNGYSEIRNDRTNLCLAIGSGSKENGAHALQWTCGGASHLEQSWDVIDAGSGLLEVRNANSGQCLAIGAGSKEDGAHLLQWPCGGATHLEQRWVGTKN
ncbi:RICIN domain-containing protein [Actinoplanes sp. L3-i22]|uniref:RICIN domain-containing protein n=1 Tax=Actinoplanes sp. L3-i22 TaxID=2836373 RepID=UPI001C866213|nr:RICIN domain-containing protein [Actinoplanes sp. L3-i22]